jgi:hypothetical protein
MMYDVNREEKAGELQVSMIGLPENGHIEAKELLCVEQTPWLVGAF